MNIEDYKYSYNKYHKIYNLEILENGKWRRLVLDKNALKSAIELNIRTKENTRNNPYKPYLFYSIKWLLKSFFKFLDKNENRINILKKNASFWFGIIIPIIATCISLIAVKDTREERQQKIKYKKDIEKLEIKIKEQKKELNGKIIILTSKLDSLNLNTSVFEKKK